MLYILKIKGTDKIPDFVQIRDENMSLKAYFRLDQQEKGLIKNHIELHKKELMELINKIPYGKIHKFEQNG